MVSFFFEGIKTFAQGARKKPPRSAKHCERKGNAAGTQRFGRASGLLLWAAGLLPSVARTLHAPTHKKQKKNVNKKNIGKQGSSKHSSERRQNAGGTQDGTQQGPAPPLGNP